MAESGQTAFSSAAEIAITRTLSIPDSNVPNPTTCEELAHLEEQYEVGWTSNEILKGGFKQVALQFPDELLRVSVPIYQSLKRRLDKEIGLYVLADTSYGSCCVDEVAAQHIDADVIVHYGYSCLSLPSRLPVLYVFSKARIDIEDAARSLLSVARQEDSLPESKKSSTLGFILISDVVYLHVSDELHVALLSSPLFPRNARIFYNPVPKRAGPIPPPSSSVVPPNPYPPLDSTSTLATRDSDSPSPPVSRHGSHRRYTLPASVPVSSCIILYVGPESLGLTNILMTHPENMVISYDPALQPRAAKVDSGRTNKLLMRRYAVVQRARDADVFGILVGTLGVASYRPLISHIRSLLRTHRKKSYTISVGKLNPSKLANFAEIECFVIVACPENSVIDAKEFLRPIVTPFELSLALTGEPSWPGNYILDFEQVIEYQAHPNNATSGDESDPDRPVFSTVTGKYRHAKRYSDGFPAGDTPTIASADPSAVILRNTDNTLTRLSDSAGAEFLQQRTFKGLEQRLGEDAPSILEQGRSGIARGYQEDHEPVDGSGGE